MNPHRREGSPGSRVRLCFLAAFALALALTSAAAQAATITVTTTVDELDVPTANGACSLREAVVSINDAADVGGCVATGDAYGTGDRIVLGTGTYGLQLAGTLEDASATGDLDIGAAASARTVTIAGEGSAVTIVDGVNLDRVFHILDLATVFLEDLTVRSGRTTHAGGILVEDLGSLTLERVSVAANVAVNTSVAPTFGGGIANFGALTLIDSTVRDNTAERYVPHTNGPPHQGGNGGGIWSNGSLLRIDGSTLYGNRARPTLISTYGLGGGLYLTDDGASAPEVVITNSSLSSNDARIGGAVFVVATVASAGEVVFNNMTITDNLATHAAGGLRIGQSVTLRNTVLAQNHSLHAPDCVADAATVAIVSGGHNFLGIADVPASLPGSLPCLDGTGTGDTMGTGAAPLEAKLRVLADNGGATLTHGLGPASPLRDSGDPTGCDDENGVELEADQRGEPRAQVTSCDIGAFEDGPVPELPIAFFTLTPCRVLDSRVSPPSLLHGVERDFTLVGTCGVPAVATIGSINLTAVGATGRGGLSVYPQDTPPPPDSTLPFPAEWARANNALVPLAADGLSARATLDAAVGDVDFIVDINGYFAPDQLGVAVDDSFVTTASGGALALDVLANDIEPEGETLLVVAVSQPPYGSVTITGGGTGISYFRGNGYCSFPDGSRSGPPDTFSYEISGGSTAIVRVDLTCTSCFTGETLVWTETGPRPIADLVVGDRVWAVDELSLLSSSAGEARLAPVLSISNRPAHDVLAVAIGDNDEILHVTREHPFWTTTHGWTKAGSLAPGDIVTTRDGALFAVRSIAILGGTQTVYNLHVGELHTFFVGASGVLVHNK